MAKIVRTRVGPQDKGSRVSRSILAQGHPLASYNSSEFEVSVRVPLDGGGSEFFKLLLNPSEVTSLMMSMRDFQTMPVWLIGGDK